MTSPDLLRRRLDLVESTIADLRRLARPEQIETDLRERRFIERTLQVAIQSAIDAAAHVVASERLGAPKGAFESIELLAQASWIDARLLDVMRRIVGFRNVLVHGYADVDLRVVQDVVAHRLDDLLAFASALRKRLEG